MTEMTEQITETERCRMGIKTDNPCPFVATETVEMYTSIEDGPHVCAYHVADDPLHDEIDEYGLALEKMEAYLKGARRNDNRVLVRDLERLEADYRARIDWLTDLAKGFKSANKNVTPFQD